ncbi:MAG: Tex family protein [Lachnospiraceae bacterium]|jgi:protein yhgF|nr:Tex family protein [Lachnospiraceae bacterium]HCI17260.1 RNA-binding transcriptional accessory protein [Lachnospiraceae bacterium]HCX42397.1 RNA-binding transcriptional accessory protein [Lachnospiraceae bacterium]
MDISAKLAEELNIKKSQAEATIKLIDEGNTIPFIARYRKEVTGALNDEILRNLYERLTYLRNLEDKKQSVLGSIEEQGKLTEELKARIEAAETLVVLEDLYRPYKQKRKTRASVAKEKGLEPLAAYILEQNAAAPLIETAQAYVDAEKGVADAKEAIDGAKDIIAEQISDEADYRIYIRNLTFEEGKIVSTAKDEKEQSVYENYYAYEEPIKKVVGHRILALNRGEKEKMLIVKIEAPTDRILRYLEKQVITADNPVTTPVLTEVIADAYTRLIAPAIEREIRNELTEKAEDGAITVFGKNLEQLLMQPPIAGRVVLGWDPAFRTGCKLAVVDETGKVLDTTVIFPTEPQNKVKESKEILKKLIKKYHVSLISVGNGTASRESEQVIAELLKELDTKVEYVIVNEAGASVYSASKLATEEFPQFDVGQRSAASIARRLQDPLAELVKIDPQSIGVGQYQHDMNQKKLSETLTGVVEDCVNKVGVDLNTASAPLLSYISGISKVVAKNIVDYRETNGRFTNRKQLLKVAKLGPKAYEQCAGFMRIQGGDNPLDATSVHPESYGAVEQLLTKTGLTMEEIRQSAKEQEKVKQTVKKQPVKKEKKVVIRNTGTAMGRALAQAMGSVTLAEDKKENKQPRATTSVLMQKVGDKKALAKELGIGELTLDDILKELEKPARDPREDMPRPLLRSDVMDLKDLKPGMVLKGTVRNVIDFGAFVDIGVHQDGLVHISQMTDKYIKHPLEAVSVGDVVDVEVMSVDIPKKRIQLTMKLSGKHK